MNVLNKKEKFSLMLSQCAGMVDIVSLPLWVGVLISYYQFSPQYAGGLLTLFLISAMCSSLIFSIFFNKILIKKNVVVIGYFLAFICFVSISFNTNHSIIMILHVIGGLGVGASLSFTHGVVGGTDNPHRNFSLLNMALGAFGIIFVFTALQVKTAFGDNYFFILIAIMMLMSSIFAAFFFPKMNLKITDDNKKISFNKYTWYCAIGITILSMTQAMVISFYENIGQINGFSEKIIALAMMLYVLISFFSAPVAFILQHKLDVKKVICIGPVFQGIFAVIMTHSANVFLYTIIGGLMTFTILFTHIFAFGLLSKLDATKRAVAATPAMLMFGSAIGPFLGGTIINYFNYQSIGLFSCVLVVIQVFLFSQLKDV